MTTIGIIGSGNIGTAVARLAVGAGQSVVISNSRGPETLVDVVERLGDAARAGTAPEAAKAGDVVVVAVPLHAEPALPAAELAGKVVITADNYYPQRDGEVAELQNGSQTSAGRLQALLPDSHVVKAFNHIQSEELATQGTPAGTPQRRALALFGDSDEARRTAAELLETYGYDVVHGGPLAESWRIQPDTPGYGPRMTTAELERALADATR